MKNDLYQAVRSLFGREIRVLAYRLGEDVHISVYGGDMAHIGAVSILSADGEIRTMCFPGHKDDAVSALWCRRLRELGVHTAVVEAGIHYDGISKEGIAAVLTACDGLWSELRREIFKEQYEKEQVAYED